MDVSRKHIFSIILIGVLAVFSTIGVIHVQLPNHDTSTSSFNVRIDVLKHPNIRTIDNSSIIYVVDITLQAVPSGESDDWDQNWQVDQITFFVDLDEFIGGAELLDFSTSELELFDTSNPVDYVFVNTDAELRGNSVEWTVYFDNNELTMYTQTITPSIEVLVPETSCSSKCEPHQIQYTTTATFIDYTLLNEHDMIKITDTEYFE